MLTPRKPSILARISRSLTVVAGGIVLTFALFLVLSRSSRR